MKKLISNGLVITFITILLAISACNEPATNSNVSNENSLKEAYEGKFLIGMAVNKKQFTETDSLSVKLIKKHCNSIVAENDMKSMYLQPEQGKFNFTIADKFVEFGEANDMFIVGHTLVWHSQTPKWLFIDNQGNDVSRDTLIERMRNHIHTVVGRYKGRVNGWDVVNEAIDDAGGLRNSKFLQIIGPDYIEMAFKFAHEADPEAELYYNDYSMNNANKRAEAVKIAQNLLSKHIRIDAIGMQAHYGLMYDVFEQVEQSIQAYSALGLKINITELDVTVLPVPNQQITADISTNYELKDEYNPYTEQLPDSIQQELTKYYSHLFQIFNKYNKHIARVTFWGVTDGQSWKNDWPIVGRTNYPLLFDRKFKPKPAFDAIIEISKE